LQDCDITFATNPDPDSAMGVSIARGIEQVTPATQAVLIALADHPGVDSSTISLIAGEWQIGAKLVQPRYEGRGGHPVLIDLSYRDELINLNPVKGLRAFFDAHRNEVRRLSVVSPYVARDMDTWEDYVRLHEDIFGRHPDVDKSGFS
jgi:molybdenum cofactor cytidylyltransferase